MRSPDKRLQPDLARGVLLRCFLYTLALSSQRRGKLWPEVRIQRPLITYLNIQTVFVLRVCIYVLAEVDKRWLLTGVSGFSPRKIQNSQVRSIYEGLCSIEPVSSENRGFMLPAVTPIPHATGPNSWHILRTLVFQADSADCASRNFNIGTSRRQFTSVPFMRPHIVLPQSQASRLTYFSGCTVLQWKLVFSSFVTI